MLPPPFERQMQALLGPEYPDFAAALQTAAPVSIRMNPAKTIPDLQGTGRVPVPWHPQGQYLAERPVFTLDPAFHAGAYYVQEASSMFLQEALRQTVDFDKPLKVLDLCAAPGGKTTLVAAMLNSESLLVANEVIRTRVGSLRENLEKWGYPNTAVTSAEAEEFTALTGFFDVVVTDAPCSGEGLFRKDPDAIREWSLPHVAHCAARQRRILSAAVESLAPGGVLAYSTCTYNLAENEENAAWFAATFDLEYIPLSILPEWQITGTEWGYHFYPHHTVGEGFFMAVFRKKAGGTPKQSLPAQFRSLKPLPKAGLPEAMRWLRADAAVRLYQTPSGEILALPTYLENDYLLLDKVLKNKWFGVNIGEFKGRDFIPSHALALSTLVSPTLAAIEFSRDQALHYLKKETFPLAPDAPQGWVLARYAGLNLGWLKSLPNRMNNYLPPERRIRMEIG